MHKSYYRIITNYNKWYETDNRGYVIKHSNGLDKSASNLDNLLDWQIVGIRKVDNFGHLGWLIRLDEAVKLSEEELLHGNGNPKYTIEDLDHGTTRIHGNHKVHGIRSIKIINS